LGWFEFLVGRYSDSIWPFSFYLKPYLFSHVSHLLAMAAAAEHWAERQRLPIEGNGGEGQGVISSLALSLSPLSLSRSLSLSLSLSSNALYHFLSQWRRRTESDGAGWLRELQSCVICDVAFLPSQFFSYLRRVLTFWGSGRAFRDWLKGGVPCGSFWVCFPVPFLFFPLAGACYYWFS
jgi:hypothetical protein